MAKPPKKNFKLKIGNLFQFENEGWTPRETAFTLGLVMVFITLLILLLKVFLLPAWGGLVTIKQEGPGIAKILKARSP